jgi:hypothetical protein
MSLWGKWLEFVSAHNQKVLAGKIGYITIGGTIFSRSSRYLRKARPVVIMHPYTVFRVAWVKK